MKKLIPCMLIIAASCSSNKNEKMTSLLNRQKDLKDSINISYAISKEFETLYRAESDTVNKEKFLDSAVFYNGLSFGYELKKKKVDYSIDSLKLMK
jgi:hypothetical protein